jgi:preprotein translocase subunit SecA
LIISGPDNENSDLYDIINPAISLLDTNDYDVDIKSKNVTLKNSGFDKIEAYLTAKHLINNDLFSENIGIYHVVSNLVKAHKGMMRDKDYVVYKDEVIIVDEFTGRLAFGRKFSNGLHQALEAKEHVTVRKSSKTNAFISYTNFFRLFKKIGGMTGTGLAEADELDEIYNLKVVGIPTNMPVIRKDDKIFKLYLNKHTMYEDALIIIKEKHQQGQPLLLCTPSVFDSEMLSEYLQKEGIQHSVLNAKNHEQEASIVAQAGRSFSITIATNMAGRGTDILLGGCVESAIKSMLQNNQDLPVEQFEEELSREFKSDKIKVEAAGGLCVVLLGALESKKSEIQFIGRAGRQGDPGESIKFVSLEDDVLMNLSKDAINRFLISLYFTERCNTNSKAQEIVTEVQDLYQSHYFEIRRNMLKYDDVINFQRKAAYEFRDYIMSTDKIKLFIKNVISIAIDDIYTKNGSVKLPLEILKNEIAKIYSVEFADLEDLRKKTEEIISKNIDNMLDDNLRSNVLNLFDEKWYELINELENLKRTIHLVSYEQKDPVFEFRQSAFNIFKDTINEFRRSALENFTKEQHTYSGLDDLSSLFGGFEQMPCFCGSGKKFKECHGNMFGDSGLFGDNNMIANMDFSKLNEMLNEDDEDDQDHESINNQAKTTDFNLNNIFNIDFSKHHTEDLEEKNTQFIDNSSNTDDHQPKEKHEIIIEKKDDEAKSDNQNYIDRRKKTDKTSKNTDNTVDNDNNIKKINNKKKKDVNEQE